MEGEISLTLELSAESLLMVSVFVQFGFRAYCSLPLENEDRDDQAAQFFC
ncbi:hypothetical protein Krac_12582 [Ktedonobacter racemifer DSM 44963]|uniref:Uncharacterized protein n=1 Tax=Ktedonobacter racemifer DSM 44963 TaxID=485913 RepID=D6THX0_KTERA|nr:hypothetical protein Krac_12582 [Ktedonobacter racemifer DSM 44963]